MEPSPMPGAEAPSPTGPTEVGDSEQPEAHNADGETEAPTDEK
jgi:hypothetical protein